MTLKERISDFGKRLGFVRIGFAAAGLCTTYDKFRKWLDAGYGAGMQYLRSQSPLRADPRTIAAGARSVIVGAIRYPTPPCPLAGFSSHVWGQDYHDVLRERLNRLADFLTSDSDITVRHVCVDSSPILEREWAARAGIGWIGRQGQVINTKFGSCLLLGELLVDHDFAPSQQEPNRCGKCRRCIESCPTGAIVADGVVDARRCISYLTIEHKGPIPLELRPLIGNSLYGCDRCTAVCPWNRFGETEVLPELRGRQLPSVEECLLMDKSAFERCFSGTSVFRTGLERLQRNAAVVIGNEKSGSVVPTLETARERATPLVQEHLSWALEQIRRRNSENG